MIIIGYQFDWTGFNGNNKSGKTLWDWLQLLIIPIALALVAIWFNRNERKNEQKIASDNQQETALQAYLDRLSELLMKEGLHTSKPEDEVRTVARVRTLTVLRQLDEYRKTYVIQFLYESDLVCASVDECIIDLTGADLNNADFFRPNGTDLSGVCLIGAELNIADLSYAYLNDADLSEAELIGAEFIETDLNKATLSDANLCYANLSKADLSGANLSKALLNRADLSEADLSGAKFNEADFSEAKLIHANLSRANLRGAIFSKADLSGADLSKAVVTDEQLAKASSLKGAIMPDGSKHP